MSPIQHKNNIKDKVAKKMKKKASPRDWSGLLPDHSGSHFPSKIDEKTDVKIDAEQVMKFMKFRCEN